MGSGPSVSDCHAAEPSASRADERHQCAHFCDGGVIAIPPRAVEQSTTSPIQMEGGGEVPIVIGDRHTVSSN